MLTNTFKSQGSVLLDAMPPTQKQQVNFNSFILF